MLITWLQKEWWEQQLALVTHEPWVVMGDLNCVLTDQDRIGGNPVTVHEVLDFLYRML